MMRMFNTDIKSKMEYCCIVWSPVSQKWIYGLEKIQKNFTSKINGMEELDYHERLKKLRGQLDLQGPKNNFDDY